MKDQVMDEIAIRENSRPVVFNDPAAAQPVYFFKTFRRIDPEEGMTVFVTAKYGKYDR